MTALLQVERLNKRFGGLHAVKDVSFALEPGSITGVLGPNGAGKTTVFNLLTGFILFDTGAVHLDGRPLAGLSPRAKGEETAPLPIDVHVIAAV